MVCEEEVELGDGATVFDGCLGAEGVETGLEEVDVFAVGMSLCFSHLWRGGL